MSLDIQPLPRRLGRRLAEIIARAFHEYPPFRRYIHADLDGDVYCEALRATFEYYVDLTYIAGDPVFGAWINNQLVGGMLTRAPKSSGGGVAAYSRSESFASLVGAEAFSRLEAFEATMHENEPAVAGGCYYIDVIAVDPGIQSHGIGRQMVEHVIGLSRDDPGSVAVCLCTESPGNHEFYRNLGFERVTSRDIGLITTTSFMVSTLGAD